jgi:hypothetical protein
VVCSSAALRESSPRFIQLLALTKRIRIRWETGATNDDREAIHGNFASLLDSSTTIVEEEVAP